MQEDNRSISMRDQTAIEKENQELKKQALDQSRLIEKQKRQIAELTEQVRKLTPPTPQVNHPGYEVNLLEQKQPKDLLEPKKLDTEELKTKPKNELYLPHRITKLPKINLESQKKLIEACQKGDAGEVKQLLQGGAKGNHQVPDLPHPFAAAVWSMNISVVVQIGMYDVISLEECKTTNAQYFKSPFCLPTSVKNYQEWANLLEKLQNSAYQQKRHLESFKKYSKWQLEHGWRSLVQNINTMAESRSPDPRELGHVNQALKHDHTAFISLLEGLINARSKKPSTK